MPSLKLSNPFRRAADRPTLKQRAADLKAGLASAARAAPVPNPKTNAGPLHANPKLVSLVTTWLDVRRRYEAVTQDDQTEEGDALFEQILLLQPAIFAFPVASVANLCAKLPVLRDEFSDIAVGPDPANPYWLRQAADVVLRDLASLSDAAASAEDGEPLTTESAASLDFEGVHVPTAIRTPRQWHERFAPHTLGLHMADRMLRMSKRELVAFIRGAGQKDSTLPVSMIKQVEAARVEAQTYAEMLDATCVRLLVAGATAIQAEEQDSPQAESSASEPAATSASASAAPREPSLVGMIDFASASLEDLRSLHDLADLVGGVAYALVWTGRCQGPHGEHNTPGKLMQWLGDALTDVETAANNEARRRRPANSADRETRLEMLAMPVIQNGDPDETEAFARDLLAHAEAERRGR